MLRFEALPPSFAVLLATLRPCFTAPSFRTFTALLVGMIAIPQCRTIIGMLTGAGLAGIWHHSRAYWFFGHARWSTDQVTAVITRLVVSGGRPVGTGVAPPGAPNVHGDHAAPQPINRSRPYRDNPPA